MKKEIVAAPPSPPSYVRWGLPWILWIFLWYPRSYIPQLNLSIIDLLVERGGSLWIGPLAVVLFGTPWFSDLEIPRQYFFNILFVKELGRHLWVRLMLLWPFIFLIRFFYYTVKRDLARDHPEHYPGKESSWWHQHRQHIGLVQWVLLGPRCADAQDACDQIASAIDPPQSTMPKISLVSGDNPTERERQIAVMIAQRWLAQWECPTSPLHCYWQGSLRAWQAFAEEVGRIAPNCVLPREPQAWLGIRSLDGIVDLLHAAPAQSQVLCAGCQSTPGVTAPSSPVGEAGFLWLLAVDGEVRIHRGEWFESGSERLSKVARRSLEQAWRSEPTPLCISFSQPDGPDIDATGWNVQRGVQNADFGVLEDLEMPVALTLAAWEASLRGESVSWCAADPAYTLALGVVGWHRSGSGRSLSRNLPFSTPKKPMRKRANIDDNWLARCHDTLLASIATTTRDRT